MSKAKAGDRFVTLRKQTRSLPCTLTDAEFCARADELSVTVQNIETEERRQSDIKAQMKARLTELEARQSQLAITVSRREEHRDVEVEFVADIPAGIVTEYRQDTGEAMRTRPMTEDEKQAALPLEATA